MAFKLRSMGFGVLSLPLRVGMHRAEGLGSGVYVFLVGFRTLGFEVFGMGFRMLGLKVQVFASEVAGLSKQNNGESNGI